MDEFASKVAAKIADEIGKLARGQKRITVRQLVKRYGFTRRTSNSVAVITATLQGAGVACQPHLEEVPGLDDTLILSLASPVSKAPVAPLAAPAMQMKAAPTVATTAPVPVALPTSPAPKTALSTQQIMAYAQQATTLICVDGGHGSGFVLERAGIVATARHVVGDAREVEVFFADGQKVTGQVLYSNATLDFAFLRVPPCKIAFKLRGEAEPYPGQRVFAIGSPRDKRLAGSVTAGIVSNLSRVEGGVEYLQTDTSISPGNSGGPLIAEDGTVVGMNVWGRTDGPGLNFALPASYLAAALEWLKPQLGEIENRAYCAPCGHLNSPDRWIECKTWICCGNCGALLAELEAESA